MVNDQVLQNVKRFEAINDRICYLEIQYRWFKIILINYYRPTGDKDEVQKSELYEDIEKIYSTLLLRTCIVVGPYDYYYIEGTT
jgi:hypothetical protein